MGVILGFRPAYFCQNLPAPPPKRVAVGYLLHRLQMLVNNPPDRDTLPSGWGLIRRWICRCAAGRYRRLVFILCRNMNVTTLVSDIGNEGGSKKAGTISSPGIDFGLTMRMTG